MSVLISIAALCFLMFAAYRGYSVILFAPIAALSAVLLTDPGSVLPVYSGLFQDKMVVFVKNYLPVFILGALFGKLVEMSGAARSISTAVVNIVGRDRAIIAIVIIGFVLTYGGVSMFVTVFAVYPFAVEMYRQSDIPKRLVPAAICVSAFTITMDALPGSPQIQNIIPTTFFGTTAWSAPWLGVIGSIYIVIICFWYLNFRVHQARVAGEGYGTGHINEPDSHDDAPDMNPWVALSPLLIVCVLNGFFTLWLIPHLYGDVSTVLLAEGGTPIIQKVSSVNGIWSVQSALVIGCLVVVALSYKTIKSKFAEGSKQAIAGSLLASINTASEYGFGSVIAALPGFTVIRSVLRSVPDPLLNEAVTINVLAGITGSASGGMSIALAAMSGEFIAAAKEAGIPLEVMHRVASMASGGMDTLPHNGAVITLLTVTGLTHKQSYGDIFFITCTKTSAAFFVILVYYLTGIV